MIFVSKYFLKLKNKRWLYCCLFILLFTSCKPHKIERDYTHQYKKIDSVKIILQTGDLIVRNGIDEVSMATRKFNRKDTSFSHCGIIQIENDSQFVYHALGGSYNPPQTLMRQPLNSFCNPKEVDKFAIYRYEFTPVENILLSEIIHEHHKNRLPFDMFFNFDTDDKMYCSEFVFKSINNATNNSAYKAVPRSQPMYITVDDLFLDNRVILIKQVIF